MGYLCCFYKVSCLYSVIHPLHHHPQERSVDSGMQGGKYQLEHIGISSEYSTIRGRHIVALEYKASSARFPRIDDRMKLVPTVGWKQTNAGKGQSRPGRKERP